MKEREDMEVFYMDGEHRVYTEKRCEGMTELVLKADADQVISELKEYNLKCQKHRKFIEAEDRELTKMVSVRNEKIKELEQELRNYREDEIGYTEDD